MQNEVRSRKIGFQMETEGESTTSASAVPPLPQASIPPEVAKRKEAIWLYLIAVGALAVMGVLLVGGMILLAWNERTLPEGASVALGSIIAGLVGMVAYQTVATK